MGRTVGLLHLLLLLALSTGCPEKPATREVRVFAAASLSVPLAEIARDFEARSPGVSIKLSFGSSSALERQVEAGSPCDVFIAASALNVARLASAALVEAPVTIARNELVAIVPRGERVPGSVADLALLPRVAVGARGVPAGDYARAALGGALSEKTLANYPDEPSVVTAVASGGAPAGICYASSLVAHPRAADLVRAFALRSPAAIEYPAAIVRAAREPDLARAFLEHVRSEQGRARLRAAGFAE